jgi:nucleotide-binding universal stress UspA family protein
MLAGARTESIPTRRRILAAIDDREASARAAHVAIDLAAEIGAEVALIHVVDPVALYVPHAMTDFLGECRREALALLESVARSDGHAVPIRGFVVVGACAEEITRIGEEWRADLLVLGANTRGWFSRALSPSVTDQVLRRSTRPVLVVRS